MIAQLIAQQNPTSTLCDTHQDLTIAHLHIFRLKELNILCFWPKRKGSANGQRKLFEKSSKSSRQEVLGSPNLENGSYFCAKTFGSQIPIFVSTLHLSSLDKFG